MSCILSEHTVHYIVIKVFSFGGLLTGCGSLYSGRIHVPGAPRCPTAVESLQLDGTK